MTEDSVMLSLRELHALEERRLLEEEEIHRRAIEARNAVAAKEAERIRRESAEASAAEDERRRRALQDEREQRAREEAIRDATLLEVRLAADALAKQRETAALVQAAAPAATSPASGGAGLWQGLTTASLAAALGVGIAWVGASQRADRAEALGRVSAIEVREGKAALEKLRTEASRRESVVHDLERTVEEARLVALVTPVPSSASPAYVGNGKKGSIRPLKGTPDTDRRPPPVCDPGDPVCGFSR